ncbi:alcohol dehydrogenase-like [Prosopis cineraria]|uniref:alcohol dehydrogenase-like n=1 Tax=Prosopis cineraria TaxID=364024 RepID=UPI00240F33D4|nr:alcohol dehydrogenase-like [Prosopis cineraria]
MYRLGLRGGFRQLRHLRNNVLFPCSSLSNHNDMSSMAGKVISCKAAVAWEAGKPLEIEEVKVDPPKENEVRVNIKYSSLCHTDLHFWKSKGTSQRFPRIYGHEASGVVESVGEGVRDVKAGDHVLTVFNGECGECRQCKSSEESNMCELLRINAEREVMISDGRSRFCINGTPVSHFLGTSTFSQYSVLHSGCLVKLHPSAPLHKLCILSCGISTGLGAALNVAKPNKGDSVAIFGLGAVGLAAAEGARIAGASRIIGVDLNPDKYEQAKKFGITEFVNPKDHDKPIQQVLIEMTDGGVDRSIECSGNIDSMTSAFEAVQDGWGVAVFVGVPKSDAEVKVNPFLFLSERTIKGTTLGNYKPKSHLPSLIDVCLNHKLELDKFITHRVGLSEINKAFDYMIKGDGLRTIIHMED